MKESAFTRLAYVYVIKRQCNIYFKAVPKPIYTYRNIQNLLLWEGTCISSRLPHIMVN